MSWLNQPYQGGYGNQQQQYGGQMGGGYQQPQRTGFQPQMQMPMQTGYGGGGLRPQMPLQMQPTGMAPPPMQMPMMTGYQQPMHTGAPQGFGPGRPQPLAPQPTGFPGSLSGGMGFQFVSTFMPSQNIQPNAFMAPSQMQFAQPNPGPSLQQTFQQRNEAQTGSSNVPIPWRITPDEKKRYDQIFRAWDQTGTGFINGATAKEVFGQSGLDSNDLMAIWNLADVEDRGRLNIDEFHIAMALVYRKLNGNPIPQTLPPEMAPSSARDLNDSVGFLKSLLKNDTNQRATADDGGQGSYAKARSLHDTAAPSNRKDATVYRHDDSATPTYKSSSRHLDRNSVRSRSGDDSANDDIEEARRRIKNTQAMLDKARNAEDNEDDLRDERRRLIRKIQRISEDIEDILRSRRSDEKDRRRRELEKELLQLEHTELPAIEKRLADAERSKQRDQKKYAMERDARNREPRDRFDDGRSRYDDDYSASSRRDRSQSSERGYNRGSYADDKKYRSSNRRRDDSSEDEDRKYSSSRRQSPPRKAREAAPEPPSPAAKPSAPAPPPPTSAPPSKAEPAAPNLASMSPADRAAYVRAEGQRRVQERLRALGLAAPSSASGSETADSSVADRLEQERQEAARKAAEADKELEAKELERQARLEREKLRGVAIEQSINQENKQTVQQVKDEIKSANAPAPAQKGAEDQIAAEEAAIAEREAALEKEKAARRAKLEQLEREVAEAREAEENFLKNKTQFQQAAKSSAPKVAPAPPPSRARPVPSAPKAPLSPAPAAAPMPPAVASPVASPPEVTSPAARSSTNPFHRLGANATSPAAEPQANGKPNPFFRPPPTPEAPGVSRAPPAPAAPAAASAPAKPAFRPPPTDDDDWDSPAALEKENDSDSSDDEGMNRDRRGKLASALFSQMSLGGPVRPPSQTATPPRNTGSPAPAAPAAPPAPSAPAAPAAPSAPVAPPAAPKAPVIEVPSGPVDRGALLGQIQGGLRLRKAETKDRSGPSVTGAVIGDPSPPEQHYSPPPREPSPEPVPLHSEPAAPVPAALPAEPAQTLTPLVQQDDPLADVDTSQEYRSRALYSYEGQRPEDLSFAENAILLVNPAKDADSSWWYGKIESTGQAGWLPKTYVEAINGKPAVASFAYSAASADEHSFEEGETISIVDDSDPNWWKAEKDGAIALVPATYFEQKAYPSAAPALSVSAPDISTDPTGANRDSDSDDDDDSDIDDERRDPKAEELERLRVLEAAGIVVRSSDDASRPGQKRRRAAPARPDHVSRFAWNEGLPDHEASHETQDEEQVTADSTPEQEEAEHEERMEDAYDVYQRVMRDLPPLPSAVIAPAVVPTPDEKENDYLDQSTASSAGKTDRHSASALFSKVLSGVQASVSRSSPAQTDRPRLSISTPMISTPTGTSDRASTSSQNVGSTWSSLIDASALTNMPDGERKRQEAIYEFIASEQSYVQSLQLVVGVFFEAIQGTLTDKAKQVIFANIEDILIFNTLFLSELEERQRESRLYVDSIGDVIARHVPGLDIYRGYCVNQSNAAHTLVDLKASNLELRAILERSRVKNLELEHFLLEPMQRLTRYPLLLNQIIRYTDESHTDHKDLVGALQVVESILSSVNETIRANENEEKLAALSDVLQFAGDTGARLDLTAPTRLLGKRRILKQGQVAKTKSGRRLNAYLFNDLILFTEPRGGAEIVYRYPFPLEETSVKEKRGEDAFVVVHRSTTVAVKAPSARQCLLWVRTINEAREQYLAAMQKHKAY